MKKIFLTTMLGAVSQMMMAQGMRISGTVSDNMGPIMMANVVERDANNRIVNAAQTDANGNFSMTIANKNNKLYVTFIGDKPQTLKIGDTTFFTIVLKPEQQTLNEVTVVANRTNSGGLMIPKREVSVSAQTFKMDNVEGMAFTSADEALQGEIAGLDIVANSGNLGSGTTMRLRGITTINGNSQPLIVVDDKVFDNPDENFDFENANEENYAALLSVNTEDIASISVLKDAASTAVWGSKGANGVIAITTKRGKRGKVRVGFSYKFTGTWQPEGYHLLSGDDYTMLLKEEFYNPAQQSDITKQVLELNYNPSWSEYENWNNNTDWVKSVTQFGAMQSWNMNLSGGGEKATFRISAGYDNQTGSIIKQRLDRFTTKLVLDYNVSDRIRFSTDFPLTYTNNVQNYDNLLGIAQKMAPNMSIYRQNADGSDTDEFYIMNPSGNPTLGNYSSSMLNSIRGLGNPVAIGYEAWKKSQTYRMTPDFNIKYELLGVEEGKSRLTFNGRLDFDIFSSSSPSYRPASLSTDPWTSGNYNLRTNDENNRFKMGARTELMFTPYINKDFSATMLLRYEMFQSRSTYQSMSMNEIPGGISDPTVDADLRKMTSSSSRSNEQDIIYNGHASYKGKYNLDVSLRADGNSKFGPKHKWAFFPSAALRWNIIDEKFMDAIKEKGLSMLGVRASWGLNGNAPSSDYLFYSTYNTSAGTYGKGTTKNTVATLDGLKLDDLRWEKKSQWNFGANVGFLKDMITVDVDIYHTKVTDLLMRSVNIPKTTGFAKLSYQNAGGMTNDGWEMNIDANNFLKIGKFSMSAGFNVSQNFNRLTEMNEAVLRDMNASWDAATRGSNSYLNRIQVDNPLGAIYGFRFKGVYQYGYDYLENYKKENGLTNAQYEGWINEQLAAGKTFPVVLDHNGHVMMNSNGSPKRVVYNYADGQATYQFQGGDAIYEDVNKDGQINALDVVYLGNSMPKVNGGFNFTFKYGNWSLKTRFMYRFGNKVINIARMDLEQMYNTFNQCSTVNWRWRKDGDVTPIPRAMYNKAYNFQGSDRFVEDGSFVRFQNLQLAYNFDRKLVKKWGLTNLQFYFSMNNLYCWTKYSGVDPEISVGAWGVAKDASQTPRAKSFTASINVGF